MQMPKPFVTTDQGLEREGGREGWVLVQLVQLSRDVAVHNGKRLSCYKIFSKYFQNFSLLGAIKKIVRQPIH